MKTPQPRFWYTTEEHDGGAQSSCQSLCSCLMSSAGNRDMPGRRLRVCIVLLASAYMTQEFPHPTHTQHMLIYSTPNAVPQTKLSYGIFRSPFRDILVFLVLLLPYRTLASHRGYGRPRYLIVCTNSTCFSDLVPSSPPYRPLANSEGNGGFLSTQSAVPAHPLDLLWKRRYCVENRPCYIYLRLPIQSRKTQQTQCGLRI